MPTENDELLSTGTLYLQNEDGTMTPFMGLAEATLLGCTEGTLEFVGEIPVVREMTFTMSIKRRPTRTMLRAMGLPTKRRSERAIGRPIRRIKRRIEKTRRWFLKNGIDRKIIIDLLKIDMEDHRDE